MEDELTPQELVAELRALGLTHERRANVLAHVSAEAADVVEGGMHALVGALLACTETLVMPSFTYGTMVVPEYGPENNGIVYGQASERNAQAVTFDVNLPADAGPGSPAEVLRVQPTTSRSAHPVLSFVAQGRWAGEILAAQTYDSPFGLIEWLEANGGFVLLLGASHRENFALHLAVQRAGRWGFVRWAVTPDEIVELPDFPGCSDGFDAMIPHLRPIAAVRDIGFVTAQLFPVAQMLAVTERRVVEDPYALLCQRATCERCRAREPG